MENLTVKITPATSRTTRRGRNIAIQFNESEFERIAANFGLFNPDFLTSIDRAEEDYRRGRVRKVASLRDIRKKK